MGHEPIYYRILENPHLYRFCQQILGPGGEKDLRAEITRNLGQLPSAELLLDVGCGPNSWLWREGLHPVGVDISFSYSQAYKGRGEPAVTASAGELPFAEGVFGAVWSIGMLHHLPDELAGMAVAEMTRVTAPGGYCMIFDAVMPRSAWLKPLAWGIRRLDRGGFMRGQDRLQGLLPGNYWAVKRCSYSWWGLEGLFCLYQKT